MCTSLVYLPHRLSMGRFNGSVPVLSIGGGRALWPNCPHELHFPANFPLWNPPRLGPDRLTLKISLSNRSASSVICWYVSYDPLVMTASLICCFKPRGYVTVRMVSSQPSSSANSLNSRVYPVADLRWPTYCIRLAASAFFVCSDSPHTNIII